MYVIKRIKGYSAGRYMAVGLVETTNDPLKAHIFEAKADAQLMAHAPYETVVTFAEASILPRVRQS